MAWRARHSAQGASDGKSRMISLCDIRSALFSHKCSGDRGSPPDGRKRTKGGLEALLSGRSPYDEPCQDQATVRWTGAEGGSSRITLRIKSGFHSVAQEGMATRCNSFSTNPVVLTSGGCRFHVLSRLRAVCIAPFQIDFVCAQFYLFKTWYLTHELREPVSRARCLLCQGSVRC